MDKKLIETLTQIELQALNFRKHIEKSLSPSAFSFVQKLSKHVKVYIFSGVIRDFFLERKSIRDLDLVIDGTYDLENDLIDYQYRKNSFGGYKIQIDDLSIDLWFIQNTWAIEHSKIIPSKLEDKIPGTVFFNFSSILFDFSENKFICKKPFLQFMNSKKINIVFKQNMNNELCVVNSFYYSDKLGLGFADKLITYLRQSYNENKRYDRVQLKHFGKILYSEHELKNRINSLKKSKEPKW